MYGLALCAGVGGIELGLQLALGPTYRCIGYVEREAYAAATLMARMEDKTLAEAPIWDDVTTFDGRPWRGRVDIISTGFPCQPWSRNGRRRQTDDDRWLWPTIAAVIADVQPDWVFMENVPELTGNGLHAVLNSLFLLGFNAEWDTFRAASVGSSQIRRRLFLLAHTRCGRDRPLPGELVAEVPPSHARQSSTDLAMRPVFPPGPDDVLRWQSLLEHHPEFAIGLEPFLFGMVDGVSVRLERLTALGNGVVPAVAATAYTVLRARLSNGTR